MQVKPVYLQQRNTVSLKTQFHTVKKKNEIFEAVEGNNASKKRKNEEMKTATYEELDYKAFSFVLPPVFDYS